MKNTWMVGLAFASAAANAAVSSSPAPSLVDQLNGLSAPANQAPASVSEEKLYAVQTRYSPLAGKWELTFGGAHNFTGSDYLQMNQMQAGLHHHLSDRWDLGLNAAYGYNEFTSTATELFAQEKRVPDVAYVKYRADLLATFRPFYGKFRVSMDQVFYFDQYLSVGPGYVWTNTRNSVAAVADAGFVFWMGRWGSLRLGLKDTYFKEERRLSAAENVHHLLGHVDLGIVFGGG